MAKKTRRKRLTKRELPRVENLSVTVGADGKPLREILMHWKDVPIDPPVGEVKSVRLFWPDGKSIRAVLELGCDVADKKRPKPSMRGLLYAMTLIPSVKKGSRDRAFNQLKSIRREARLKPLKHLGDITGYVQPVDMMEQSIRDCQKRWREHQSAHPRVPLPDQAYIEHMKTFIRDAAKEAPPFGMVPGYVKFRKELLMSAAIDPKWASDELRRAQKAENADRKVFPRLFATDVRDAICGVYQMGMQAVRLQMARDGNALDPVSLGLYDFVHQTHDYLDGLLPILHPVYRLLTASSRFLQAAVQHFLDPADREAAAAFFGALDAAFTVYSHIVIASRLDDRDRQVRKKTYAPDTSDNSDALADVVYDEAPKVAVPEKLTLHDAAKIGDVKTLRKLLDSGEDVDGEEVDDRDQHRITPLHLAAYYEQDAAVRLLIERGADVNAVADAGLTPLHLAVMKASSMKTVEILLDAGADPNMQDNKDQTALDLCKDKGVEALLRDRGAKPGSEP